MIEPVSDAWTTSIRPALEGEERDDQLGDVAERGVEDAADLRAGQRPEPFGREADDPGETEDGRRREHEQDRLVGVQPEVEDDRDDAQGDRPDQEDARQHRELAEDGQAGPGLIGHRLNPIGRDRPRRVGDARSRSRMRPALPRRPGRRPGGDQPFDRGARRLERVVLVSEPRSDARSATTRRRARIRPAAGSRQTRPLAASSASVPRTIVSCSLVSSRQTRRGPFAAARLREITQRRGDPARRLVHDRAALVVGDAARAGRDARARCAAGNPRTPSAVRPRPMPRPRPGPPMRPGEAPPGHPRRPTPRRGRRPGR